MHLRPRYLSKLVKKKQTVFPIVGVLGARQVGKSTLLRDLIGKARSIPYFTLDRPNILKEVRTNPESFVLVNTNDFSAPVIIDEAHKAPQIFDVLKVLSDERGTRGTVIITGSVDFALANGVRETMTGRIGLCRLYPLTVSELAGRPCSDRWSKPLNLLQSRTSSDFQATMTEVHTWLERGGMPAICQLSNETQRSLLIEDWLQSVCYRDLLQLRGARYDGALAREILSVICNRDEVSESEIAAELGEDTRRIKTHVRGLEALFVITRIKAFRAEGGTGADRFLVLDCAIARYLGATSKVLTKILILNEVLAGFEYGNLGPVNVFHFTKRGQTKIDFVFKSLKDSIPIVVSEHSSPRTALIKSLKAIREGSKLAAIMIAAPVSSILTIDEGIAVVPIESFCN